MDLLSLSRDEIELVTQSSRKRHATVAANAVALLEQDLRDYEQLEHEILAFGGAHGSSTPDNADHTMFDFDVTKHDDHWADEPFNVDEPSFLVQNNTTFNLDLSADHGASTPDAANAANGSTAAAGAGADATDTDGLAHDVAHLSLGLDADLSMDLSALSATQTDADATAPPAGPTRLLAQYFPALRTQSQPPAPAQVALPPTPPSGSRVLDPADSAAQDELASARAQLSRERQQLEREKIALDREKLDFRKQKRDYEDQRRSEMVALDEEKKKLKRDKLFLEKTRKLAETVPNRKDRQEIDDLKRQVADLQNQIKAKDSKAKLEQDRLKKRVDELMAKNKELADELHVLETERVNGAVSTAAPAATTAASAIGTPSGIPSGPTSMLGRPLSPPMSSGGSVLGSAIGTPATSLASLAKRSGTGSSSALPMSPRMRHLQGASPPPGASPYGNGSSAMSTISGKSGSSGGSMHKPRNTAGGSAAPALAVPGGGGGGSGGSALGVPRRPPTAAPRDTEAGGMSSGRSVLSSMTFAPTLTGEPAAHWRHYFETVERISQLGHFVTEKTHRDGIRERRYADGTRVVLYKNGTTKEYKMSGHEITRYTNNDVKEVFPDGKYEIWTKEKKKRVMPNGEIKIVFADGTRQKILPDGRMRVVDPHGRILKDEIGDDG
ncbi:hypothetical protein AMAG_11796 [Allomyces macrogynus ATCC 38327]|uniref:Centromere protein J C-terminal domain-containing protein n=1 Tax=Allomyces macrogynus (strain ATCC 38327) TaxID=578462 RepID=A0A0L0SY97_ALLM3|nr:hypothetical protein AMAG_11796 [Allomyces macrogynus ATCC 38327]|eukprot:KNE67324.1 hypothetical protein AMAG_11796 [Allomyces macrogynus ATCC 38327]